MTQAEAITKLVNAQSRIIEAVLKQMKLNEQRARNAQEIGDHEGAKAYATAASAQAEVLTIIYKEIEAI